MTSPLTDLRRTLISVGFPRAQWTRRAAERLLGSRGLRRRRPTREGSFLVYPQNSPRDLPAIYRQTEPVGRRTIELIWGAGGRDA